MTTYSELRLRIDRGVGRGSYRIVATGPAGEALGRFRLPFSDTELELFILKVGSTRRGRRRIDSPEMELAKTFGTKLFGALFEGDVRELYRSSFAETRSAGKGLRVTLSLTGAPELLQVPWEYLYDHPSFLSISTWTPIVRYLDLTKPRRPLQVALPLRILALVSAPEDAEPIDAAQERRKLEAALEPLISVGAIAVDWLEEASLRALQRKLRKADYHVFHYIGHGGYDQAADDGILLFEEEGGRSRRVSGVELGTILADAVSLRLAVLNSCEGARSSLQDPFSGVATSLIEREIPAVIGMQFEITDRAAIVFAGEFYAALADGLPVDSCVAEARKAIFADHNDIEWGTPVLFMRVSDGRLFDVEAHAPVRSAVPEPQVAVVDLRAAEIAAAAAVDLRADETAAADAAALRESERERAEAAERERAEAAERERAEAEAAERERVAAQAEQDRLRGEEERERAEAEAAERERAEAAERERAEAAERERAEAAERERAEAAERELAAEAERQRAREEAERAAAAAAAAAESERLEREAKVDRAAAAQAEQDRQRGEAARLESERQAALAAAAAEAERIEAERAEAERAEAERAEAERAEAERAEAERAEAERAEAERAEAERAEAERAEAERAEAERAEAERAEAERAEAERAEAERAEAERAEQARLQRDAEVTAERERSAAEAEQRARQPGSTPSSVGEGTAGVAAAAVRAPDATGAATVRAPDATVAATSSVVATSGSRDVPLDLSWAAGRAALGGILAVVLADLWLLLVTPNKFDENIGPTLDSFLGLAVATAISMAAAVALAESLVPALRVPDGAIYRPVGSNRRAAAAIQGALTGATVGFIVVVVSNRDSHPEYLAPVTVVLAAVTAAIGFAIAETVLLRLGRQPATAPAAIREPGTTDGAYATPAGPAVSSTWPGPFRTAARAAMGGLLGIGLIWAWVYFYYHDSFESADFEAVLAFFRTEAVVVVVAITAAVTLAEARLPAVRVPDGSVYRLVGRNRWAATAMEGAFAGLAVGWVATILLYLIVRPSDSQLNPEAALLHTIFTSLGFVLAEAILYRFWPRSDAAPHR